MASEVADTPASVVVGGVEMGDVGDGSLDVDQLLRVAYGAEEFGKTGHSLAGHSITGEVDVASVLENGRGSSLLYGELLPAGVTRLVEALFAQRSETSASGPVLELGMGTGKVALQIFLTLHRDVYGVELAPSRWALADAAMQRIAEAAPVRFRHEATGESRSRLVDLSKHTSCDITCGSLLDTPAQLLASASAIVMEVCLPKEVQLLASKILQQCHAGCRVVCYAPLRGLVEGCRLAPVRPVPGACATDDSETLGDGVGGLSLPASWKDAGHGFAFYELAQSAEAATAAWEAAALDQASACISVDGTGNPSRARRLRYTDDVLAMPRECYSWGKGDKVLVGYSWLPFPDLGNPGDGTATGLDGVTWMSAQVIAIDGDGFATICYQDDGTVEEQVHPERIRKEGHLEPRAALDIDWGDDSDSGNA